VIYRVGVSHGADGPVATVFDLPGCSIQGPDLAGLRELLPVAIAEHLAWLARHGDAAQAGHHIQVEVTEEVDPAQSEAADGEFCFADDLRPLTDGDIERAILRMGHARRDLLALLDPLPDAVLDWRPQQSAMAKVDPWNPGVLTAREIAASVASSEGYYRTALGDDPAPVPAGRLTDLAFQRELTIERLRRLSTAERGKLFHVTRSWQDRPEHWTARKVIRRIIGHERFHTKEIEQRLAWLQLGLPDFSRASMAREQSMSKA
jgi:hypothetical protein